MKTKLQPQAHETREENLAFPTPAEDKHTIDSRDRKLTASEKFVYAEDCDRDTVV